MRRRLRTLRWWVGKEGPFVLFCRLNMVSRLAHHMVVPRRSVVRTLVTRRLKRRKCRVCAREQTVGRCDQNKSLHKSRGGELSSRSMGGVAAARFKQHVADRNVHSRRYEKTCIFFGHSKIGWFLSPVVLMRARERSIVHQSNAQTGLLGGQNSPSKKIPATVCRLTLARAYVTITNRPRPVDRCVTILQHTLISAKKYAIASVLAPPASLVTVLEPRAHDIDPPVHDLRTPAETLARASIVSLDRSIRITTLHVAISLKRKRRRAASMPP
jgi:hypothetical protein